MSSENSLKKVTCEQWRDIQGFEGLYQISDHGRVKSNDRVISQSNRYGTTTIHVYKGRILKESMNPNGYIHVDLHKEGKTIRFLIHRLVAIHFLEKQDGQNIINHLDGNKSNNTVSNLEWCTQSQNIQYAYDHGTKIPPHMKRIAQYDMDGNLIKIWSSVSDVCRELKLQSSNIAKVCRGQRNHAGGFKWQYTE